MGRDDLCRPSASGSCDDPPPNFLSKDIRDTLPPWATSQTVSLGLDLRGGAHLLLAVDRADLATARLQELRQILVSEMRSLNLNPAMIRADVTSLSAPANEALVAALQAAAPGFEPDTGRPIVTFDFDRQGGAAFAEITVADIGQRFAVLLDGEVLTAPVIQQAIPGGQGQITGDFTLEEAQPLAVLLTSGAMPASLDVIEERSVGAALGADSIRAGLVTGAIGLVLIVAIMVRLYGGWDLLASAILGLNVMLTRTALGLLGATLTLPGIAGIILCLGIAVDSNILIWSLIREETAKGAIAIKALTLGYGRAWATILDAKITTLLAMLAYIWARFEWHQDLRRHRAYGTGGEPEHHRRPADADRLLGQRQGGSL